MESNLNRGKNTKISSAAYHLSGDFDLLDKSVLKKSAAFVCNLQSVKTSKDLKVQNNNGFIEDHGLASVTNLNLSPVF
jgi:hypothetical protein